MAKEYIEREALFEAIRKDYEPISFSMVCRHIDEAPAADVVEVVRCKDCSIYEQGSPGLGWCSVCDFVRMDNDFCSYGERR